MKIAHRGASAASVAGHNQDRHGQLYDRFDVRDGKKTFETYLAQLIGFDVDENLCT